ESPGRKTAHETALPTRARRSGAEGPPAHPSARPPSPRQPARQPPARPSRARRPDHRIARDPRRERLLAEPLGPRGPFGQNQVADLRARVPDADLDAL